MSDLTSKTTNQYSAYYQAHVLREKTWFFTAVLRSYEHMVFDRTLDKQSGLFEFFVPQAMEPAFLTLMAYFEGEGIVSGLRKTANRLS